MTKRIVAGIAILGLAVTVGLQAADKAEKGEKGKKGRKARAVCPVSGKKINKEASVEYKDAKLYFCCEGCPNAFKKNPEKFAAKANHQLVVTRQYRVAKCPFTGRKLNRQTRINVEGAVVCFCCNNCKGKAEKSDEKIALIFNDQAFEKGFAKRQKKGKKGE